MTDPNYTHVTMVVDRSGSMNYVRDDAEGGVNTFIDGHKTAPGKCTFLLRQFDETTPSDTVYGPGPIADAPRYILVPRGNTPLRDAVGSAIVITGEYLAAMAEDERPGKVIFVIQTDGQENASKEWTLDALKASIKEHIEVYGWEIVYLGAATPVRVAADAAAMGIPRANYVAYVSAGTGTSATMGSVLQSTLNVRSTGAKGTYAENVDEHGNVIQRT